MADNHVVIRSPQLPRLQQISLLFAAVMLIVFRSPELFLMPRFWAEEGTYFFSFAYTHRWFETLLHAVPHLGYYSLIHNIAALCATFAPLEFAPIVTMAFGCLSYLVPCWIVIIGNSKFWDSVSKKLLICTGILLFSFGRNWLTTTYIHFNLALILFFILLENMDQHPKHIRYFFRSIIAISGLSGAVACFLVPAFIVKAWRSRNREDIFQAGLIIAASIIQIFVVIYLFTTLPETRLARQANFGYEPLWSIILFQFGIPVYGDYIFFGSELVAFLNAKLFYSYVLPGYNVLGNSILLFKDTFSFGLIFPVITYVMYLSYRYVIKERLLLPVISFWLVFLLSSLGSVKMMGGSRYAYVPTVILFVLFVAELHSQHRTRKIIAALIITLMLIANGYAYRKSIEIYSPRWSEEVASWKHNHSYRLKIWPYNGSNDVWEVALTKPRPQGN